MRTFEEDSAKTLNAEPWMLDLFKLNPEYVHWGPHEDYMATGKDSGWTAPVEVASWPEFTWKLDELNECVNFYFHVVRDSQPCLECEGSGYSPEAQRFNREWYGSIYDAGFDPASTGSVPFSADHPKIMTMAERNCAQGSVRTVGTVALIARNARRLADLFNASWSHHLAQVDVDALVAADRLWEFTRRPRTAEQSRQLAGSGRHWLPEWNGYTPTAAEVNEWALDGMGHDSINASVCVSARCEREGVARECSCCAGEGYLYTAPAAHVELVLWMIHPRKGASRGVEVKRIEAIDLPAVFAWLRAAAERNAARFAALPEATA